MQEPAEQLRDQPNHSRCRIVQAAVLAVALVVRVAYLRQLSGSVLFDRPQGDALLHFNLARDIAGGDWLGDRVFYYAPLYPYVVAAVFSVAGTSVRAVAIMQALLSTFDVWLIMSIATRLFARRAGLIAGLLAACYGPFVFYTGFLLKESVGLVLLDAFILVALRLRAQPAAWANGLAGLLLGLDSLVRPNLLLLALPVVVWIWIEAGHVDRLRRALLCGAFGAGVLAAIAPVAARNYYVGRELVLISAHGGHNFYMGNRPDATGLYEPLVPGGGQSPYEEERDAKALAEQATRRPMTAAEVSRYWYARGWREIYRHPLHFLRVTVRKFALFWNDYEVPDFQDFYFVRREAPVLWLAPLTFGLVAPLAGVGIWATRGEWRKTLPLCLVAAAVLLSVLPFFIFARYRLPVVPVLLVFAAAGGARLADELAVRDGRSLRLFAAVAVAAAIFVNWPIYRPSRFLDTSYYNIGLLYREAGRTDEAIAAWREALRLNSDYRKVWRALGEAYFEAGEFRDAADALSRAAEFAGPNFSADADLVYMLALGRAKAGDRDDARRLFDLGRRRWPRDERFGHALPDPPAPQPE